MQTTKRIYLDLDSTFRDRTLWPSPGEFEVLLAQGGSSTRSILDSRDPVALSAPLLAWTSNRFQSNLASSAIVSGTVLGGPGIGSANTARVVIFSAASGALQQADDYYCNAFLSTAAGTKVKVVSYTFLGGAASDIGKVTLDHDLSLAAGATVTLQDPTDLSVSRLFVPMGEHRANNYFRMLIYNESLQQSRSITNLDIDTGTIVIGPPNTPTWSEDHNYSIRTQVPYQTFIAGASTTTNVALTGAPSQPNIFTGWFLRVRPTVYDNNLTPPQGEIRRITSYLAASQTAVVHPALGASPTGLQVEILPYSYDNASRVSYTGTLEQELVPYNIKLTSAILPNQILASKDGSRIAFYPYVYVELSTLDGTASNLIMSNNFNAVKALFKVPIDNIEDLIQTTFVKCDSDNMSQVVRFKADSNFKVRVILPDGEVFKTIEPERYSPHEPNPIGQISLQFELTRFY